MVTYAARYDDIPKVVNVSGRFWCNTGKSGTPSAVAWAASMTRQQARLAEVYWPLWLKLPWAVSCMNSKLQLLCLAASRCQVANRGQIRHAGVCVSCALCLQQCGRLRMLGWHWCSHVVLPMPAPQHWSGILYNQSAKHIQTPMHMQTCTAIVSDAVHIIPCLSSAGITERFGEGIIDKVKAEGSVELPDGPHGQPWSLTDEVRGRDNQQISLFNMASRRTGASRPRQYCPVKAQQLTILCSFSEGSPTSVRLFQHIVLMSSRFTSLQAHLGLSC